MQTLEVISVNLWQILISLLNLVILFLLIKRFLFKPTVAMLESRQAKLDKKYQDAETALNEANADRATWNKKLQTAQSEADTILQTAVKNATLRSNEIIEDARSKASVLLRQAEAQAQLEIKRAEDSIKQEIVNISVALASKLISREITPSTHRDLINSFLARIGEADDSKN